MSKLKVRLTMLAKWILILAPGHYCFVKDINVCVDKKNAFDSRYVL